MDRDRFDALTRSLAVRGSRRRVLSRLIRGGAALLAGAALSRPQQEASARHCTSDGCSCRTGNGNPCDSGLVCCPRSQTFPGPGVCQTEDECYYGTSCAQVGAACAGYCGWDGPCGACCSGYCGNYGLCDTQACTSVGCACDSGTYQACDYGLTCCPYDITVYGGPGICQYGC